MMDRSGRARSSKYITNKTPTNVKHHEHEAAFLLINDGPPVYISPSLIRSKEGAVLRGPLPFLHDGINPEVSLKTHKRCAASTRSCNVHMNRYHCFIYQTDCSVKAPSQPILDWQWSNHQCHLRTSLHAYLPPLYLSTPLAYPTVELGGQFV